MYYSIASQYLRLECPTDLQYSVHSLQPYMIHNDINEESIVVELMRFRFPERMVPEHSDNYSGFLTHTSNDPEKAPFVFCFREGSLLFGMQKEKAGNYHIYVHSQLSIACRTAIQYVLLLEGCWKQFLGFHAVTIENQNRGILFSAPSGTGKTTHTELWKKEFGSKIINGDFAMLRCDEKSITFHGTPFCGSSNYAEKGIWPITDIVFLNQAPNNHIKRISSINAITNIMQNCFIPKWDKEITQQCMTLIGFLLKNVNMWKLECNMDPEAAHIARNAIMSGIQSDKDEEDS